MHQVTVDADTTDADVSPEPGTLFRLGGIITCDTGAPGPVVVTLSSETGRRRAQTSCPLGSYQFQGLAPGAYEVFATLQDASASGFIELFLDHDLDAGNVSIMQVPTAPPIFRSRSRAGVRTCRKPKPRAISPGRAPLSPRDTGSFAHALQPAS